MSKKQKLFNRLENLFTNIEEKSIQTHPEHLLSRSGWSWQIDGDGFFTSCSPEIYGLLDLPPEDVVGQSSFSFCLEKDDSIVFQNLLRSISFPAEAILNFNTPQQSFKVRVHVLSQHKKDGTISGWSGFNQILSKTNHKADISKDQSSEKPQIVSQPLPSLSSQAAQNINLSPSGFSAQPWTQAALDSITTQKTIIQNSKDDSLAVIAVPFKIGEQNAGVIEILDETPLREWEEDERLLVQEIANQLGLAIENAQLYSAIQAVASERQRYLQEAERRALELQTAAEIARDTTQTLSLEELLGQNVNLLCERFGFYHASIFLLDDTGEYAVVRASTGKAGQEMLARKHQLAVGSRSIIGTVTAQNKPVIVNDVFKSKTHYRNPLLPHTRSEMGIPLNLGDKVIGAIDLQSTSQNAFSEADLTVFQILSDQIAIAIENARAYELAQRAIEEMREVDRMKSQFLANMSHELRTPLNSIIGFSRVIIKGIDGPINEVQEQDLKAIYNSGQHLLNLINDILDLSKIEAGKMTLSFEELHLGDLVNSVMSTASGLVKDKPVKLIQDVPDDLPVVIADHTRIRQVLLNFISNAAKFTDKGTITIKARVQSHPQTGKEILVAITDTGQGIAEEDRYKLFQAFSQVDDSPTRKTGGTGLGLAISRHLIEMHQGRIGLLSSTVGEGSTFFFSLPIAQENLPAEAEQEIDTQKDIVLAIDDEYQIIELYQRYLSQHGYQIKPLTRPQDAVEEAKRLKPFAITLDIIMPEKDGWRVLQDLKNDPETKDIPVIICSILEEEEKGFQLGAADYLVKPFLQDDLLHAINRLNLNGTLQRVLVIDDNPADLRLVQKMLTGQDSYQVTLAEGGETGWLKIQEQKPDILILDLFMPDMNGFTILENINQSTELCDLPVIILTGADLSPEQHKQLSEFGQHLLSKGFLRKQELLQHLESALKRIHR